MEKPIIQKLFGNIAKGYDLANRCLTLGIDQYWRYQMIQELKRTHPEMVIDCATGSGDVAFCIAKHLSKVKKIIGLDFCAPMLEIAKNKQAQLILKKKAFVNKIEFIEGDCLTPPFSAESVDAITLAFGLRNFENRIAGLQALYKLLKPSGVLIILEVSQPYWFFKKIYYGYLKYIMPYFAGLLIRNVDAYRYLADSAEKFPDAPTLKSQLESIGFSCVRYRRLTLGVVAIHIAQK